MVLDPRYLNAIKGFEGFYPKPYWDVRQWSVGYGSKASGPNDVVDQAEAERRLTSELQSAATMVDQFAPNLDAGTRAALTSLTYNAGPSWMKSGLGQAIKSGNMDAARASFLQYANAGGKPLEGLRKRRADEVAWFGQPGDRGGSMNGGYGMSPQGAAGIAGPVQTQTPKDDVSALFKDFQFGLQPSSTPSPAPSGGGINLPFGFKLAGASGGDLPQIPQHATMPDDPLSGVQWSGVDMTNLMQLAQSRRKVGV